MYRFLTMYLLLGAILSVVMYMTSRHPLPFGREIRAHLAIALFWPIVLINIGRIFGRLRKNEEQSRGNDSSD